MDESEEIFCLNYELRTLADILLRNEAERWVPNFIYTVTEVEHIDRYKLACTYAAGKKVLDIACGSGRGTYMLATEGKAEIVEGYDIQLDALRYANRRNKAPNNSFEYADAEKFSVYNKYDLAVSFETIEHIPDYAKFLENIHNSLINDGLFLVSTPISEISINDSPNNPYHIREWGFETFQNLISEYFSIEKIYVQLFSHNPPPTPEPTPTPIVKLSFKERLIRKLKRIFGFNEVIEMIEIEPITPPVIPSAAVESPKYPILEEYTNQYNITELGKMRVGYQIILARKK